MTSYYFMHTPEANHTALQHTSLKRVTLRYGTHMNSHVTYMAKARHTCHALTTVISHSAVAHITKARHTEIWHTYE